MEVNNVSRDLHDHSTTNFAGNFAQGSGSVHDYSQQFNANHQHQGSVTYVTHVHNHYGQSQGFSLYNPFLVPDLLPHPGGIFNSITYPPPVILSPRPPSPLPDSKPQSTESNRGADPLACSSPDEITRTPRDRRRDPEGSCGQSSDSEISVEELAHRAAKLIASESELKLKLFGLKKGLSRLKEKEEEEESRMDLPVIEYRVRETLKRLEQDHICPLCYDVLAAPYMLNAPDCGHTFCGICLLKWTLSRLHDCGAWHEHLACPCCRAEAPAPDRRISFPLIPNRFVGSAVGDLLDALAAVPESVVEILPGNGEGVNLKGQIEAWREGGQVRTEWLELERQGKEEMATLTKGWRSFRPQDWVSVKARLGV